jgi:hypothetical protein
LEQDLLPDLEWRIEEGVANAGAERLEPLQQPDLPLPLLHVATWIEAQTRELAAPTVKQRLAAVRHLLWIRPTRPNAPPADVARQVTIAYPAGRFGVCYRREKLAPRRRAPRGAPLTRGDGASLPKAAGKQAGWALLYDPFQAPLGEQVV